MTASPTDYTRYRDYSQFQSDNPDTDLNGADLDTDFDRIKTSIDQANDAIAEVRRSDGALANEIVGVDQLMAETIAIMGDWTPRGSWVTATAYVKKDLVRQTNNLYACVTAHTSGTFATDLTAEKWMLLGPATGGTSVSNTPAGNISSVTVQAAINELDSEKQPLDATLTAIAGVTVAANKLVYATGADAFATTDLTAAAISVLDDTTTAAMLTTLGALPKAGGTMTGAIVLPGNPASALQAAPKQYVDAVAGSASAGIAGGRLTLETAVAASVTDQTAKTSVFYTPYVSNLVPIYDGSVWTPVVFSELTLPLDSNSGHTGYHQSGKNFDVFVYGSTATLGTGPAWSSDTARSAAISRIAGRLVNTASITLRFGTGTSDTAVLAAGLATYVGTIRASADGQTEDSLAKRFVWNTYNRMPRSMRVIELTDSWTYSTNAYHQANASTANQLAFIRGLNEDTARATVQSIVASSGATVRTVLTAIGLDVTNALSGLVGITGVSSAFNSSIAAHYDGFPGLGYHFLAWLEQGAGADTQTWLGDNGAAAVQSGISGMVFA